MYLNNNRISTRQAYRISVLENIAISTMLMPYVTLKLAGTKHFLAFGIGLILCGFYCCMMYLFSKGLESRECDFLYFHKLQNGKIVNTIFLKIIDGIYVIRYVMRTGVILLFFAKIVQQYMLPEISILSIIIVFSIVCGYGANRTFEKRGRIMEFLFWWVLVPLILVAVFSISNLEFGNTKVYSTELLFNEESIICGAYGILFLLSTVELTMFTLSKQNRNNAKNATKIYFSIFFIVGISYVYIMGILGKKWILSGCTSSFNVMESATIPGGLLTRMDYPVLSFWILSVFALVSGYMHFGFEFLKDFSKKIGDEQRIPKREGICKSWSFVFLFEALVIGFLMALKIEKIRMICRILLLWADIPFSILAPCYFLLRMRKKDDYDVNRAKKNIEKKKGISRKMGILLWAILLSMQVTGCERKVKSLENRDYVTSIIIENIDPKNESYSFSLSIVDLTDYKGASQHFLETETIVMEGDSLSSIEEMYFKEYNQYIDFGHLENVMLVGQCDDIILEMSERPQIPKSIELENENEKTTLREYIKAIYEG